MALARSARVASRAAIATRALVGAAPVRGMVTMSDRERAMEVSAAVLASPRAFGWFACRGGASSALELHSRRPVGDFTRRLRTSTRRRSSCCA